MKTVIIGAGFTGLAAGIKTGATIYEQSSHAGGICTDYVKDGFRFSNGGPHYLFGKDKGLEYIKTLVEVKEYERKAGVYYNHTFPYPFQSFAEKEITWRDDKWDSFKTSLFTKFGQPQCNLFFHPFNEKYTAGLMDSIISQDEYKSPKTGTGWVSTFCDPVNGLSDLVDKMASQCDIKFQRPVVGIDVDRKRVFIGKKENDKEFIFYEEYDKLISTIPLNKCMELCGQKVNLPYTSVLVINIGALKGKLCPTEHWIYVPFCKSGFHRVAFYTNVDESKGQGSGTVGLSVEIAFRSDLIADYAIAKQVIRELLDWNWIGKVLTYQCDVVPCAYTWQYNKEDVPNALAWLKERDIYSIGRYGFWKFQGLTKSIEDGFNV